MSFLERIEQGVTVGVRPHQVILGIQGRPARIAVVETMGFESYVHLDLDGEALVARVEGVPPEPGPARVTLQRCYRFEPGTGVRLADGPVVDA